MIDLAWSRRQPGAPGWRKADSFDGDLAGLVGWCGLRQASLCISDLRYGGELGCWASTAEFRARFSRLVPGRMGCVSLKRYQRADVTKETTHHELSEKGSAALAGHDRIDAMAAAFARIRAEQPLDCTLCCGRTQD